ncbi:MAG TPA: multiheme c-type cytochrome [Mucilaginibacter sp.]|jgi:hypothetical protein
MKKTKYIRLAIIFLVPLSFIFSQCFHKNKAVDPRGDAYAGAASCIKCHKNIERDYFHTAHYLSSRPASAATIHGSFNPDSNTVALNDSIKVVMEKHKDGIYQASYTGGKLTKRERFDMTFGSNRGETFLYWKNNRVYQMPITYYISLHRWANSPGYSSDSANFTRVIGSRCFECHSSYIQNLPDTSTAEKTDLLDKNSLMLGIDCERCHGPGAAHVNFHIENPAEKKAMYITKISSLTRGQRIDMCSVCHAGNSSVMTKSTFDFKPGDTLANYTSGERFHHFQDVAKVDVHGNQVKLLMSSKCFMSSKIECGTCHTIHSNEVKSVQMYSARCTGCHSVANHNFCKMATKLGNAINSNCIDCHMPVKTSNAILINGMGKQITSPFLARTHLIAIYPEESKKIMEWMGR